MDENKKYIIRIANDKDVDSVVEAVRLLISELRNNAEVILSPNSKKVAHEIICDKDKGVIFVAERTDESKEIIGCITVSLQEAIHIGGKYALIQDLWVKPNFRSLNIGAKLVAEVENYCKENSFDDLEVCLPKRSFKGFEKTSNFYKNQNFSEISTRMRKEVELKSKR